MSKTAGHARRIGAVALAAAAGLSVALGVVCAWASVQLIALRSLLDEIVCLVCREEIRLLGYTFTWPAAPIAAVLCLSLGAAAAVSGWRARTTHRAVLATRRDGEVSQRPS